MGLCLHGPHWNHTKIRCDQKFHRSTIAASPSSVPCSFASILHRTSLTLRSGFRACVRYVFCSGFKRLSFSFLPEPCVDKKAAAKPGWSEYEYNMKSRKNVWTFRCVKFGWLGVRQPFYQPHNTATVTSVQLRGQRKKKQSLEVCFQVSPSLVPQKMHGLVSKLVQVFH